MKQQQQLLAICLFVFFANSISWVPCFEDKCPQQAAACDKDYPSCSDELNKCMDQCGGLDVNCFTFCITGSENQNSKNVWACVVKSGCLG